MPRQFRVTKREELTGFVQNVVNRLSGEDIEGSEVQLRWKRVAESRRDPDENAFCEAAGALGLDPYAIAGEDVDFIMRAGGVLSGAPLTEFLAGVNSIRLAGRYGALASVAGATREVGPRSRLPKLRGAASEVDCGLRERRNGEGVWGPAYRLARGFRQTIGVNKDYEFDSVCSIGRDAGKCVFRTVRGFVGSRRRRVARCGRTRPSAKVSLRASVVREFQLGSGHWRRGLLLGGWTFGD